SGPGPARRRTPPMRPPGGSCERASSVGTPHQARWFGRRVRRTSSEEDAVPTYIMLSTLTPEGIQTVRNNPQRIREVNKEVEQLGAEVKAQWATLGSFDFVNVIEAPDDKTMARISLELGSRGTGHYETLIAIPIDDFIAAL